MKARSPLLGYNHNIRYNGRLYHVQTEDSGVNNPHIFTHLFHGGTILASHRSDYDPTHDDGSAIGMALVNGDSFSTAGSADLRCASIRGNEIVAREIRLIATQVATLHVQ